MKIRNGFVSNSSSSSFMIYGASVPKDEIRQALRATFTKKDEKELEEYLEGCESDEEREDRISDYLNDDLVFNAESKFKGLEFHGAYDWDDLYVGLSWNQVKNDETGAEFKARVTKLVEAAFGKKKLATYSEVVYDG